MYDIDYTFDNVKLDELTDEYIDKYLIKIDLKQQIKFFKKNIITYTRFN